MLKYLRKRWCQILFDTLTVSTDCKAGFLQICESPTDYYPFSLYDELNWHFLRRGLSYERWTHQDEGEPLVHRQVNWCTILIILGLRNGAEIGGHEFEAFWTKLWIPNGSQPLQTISPPDDKKRERRLVDRDLACKSTCFGDHRWINPWEKAKEQLGT